MFVVDNQNPIFDKTMPNDYSETSEFRKEIVRLNTFAGWSVSFISKTMLASNGFYYIGHSIYPDLVKCYFCNVELGNWDEGDDIEDEHKRWSPYCRILSNPSATDNVPINIYYIPEKVKKDMPTETFNGNFANVIPNTIDRKVTKPLFPNYVVPSNRLRSFANWPVSLPQSPKTLSDAGFFYFGSGDAVQCFSCGGGLKNWSPDAVPLEQHELLYSHCEYIKFLQLERGSSMKELNDETNSNLCKICLKNPLNSTFIPCGHIYSCMECGKKLKACPCCRQCIQECFKVYFI